MPNLSRLIAVFLQRIKKRRSQTSASPFTVMFILFANLGLEVVYNVTNGDELTQVIVIDLDIESFLAKKNEVSQLQRVDTEVIAEARLRGDVIGIFNVELRDEQVFDFF